MALRKSRPITSEQTTASRQAKADQKLADSPSPALERAALGDWAKANNPSPEEQRLEAERLAAINRMNGGAPG